MLAGGKPEETSPAILAWLADAAARLAAAQQARTLPRDRRQPAREALARVFDALETATPDVDLLRAVEDLLAEPIPPFSLAWPLVARHTRRWRPLRRPAFRSAVRMRGALDPVLMERFAWRFDLHDRIVERLQRVLDTFKSPVEPLEKAAIRASKLAADELDLALTRG